MSLSCALKIMEEKKYISIEKSTDNFRGSKLLMIPYYDITTRVAGEKILEKIQEAIVQSENYKAGKIKCFSTNEGFRYSLEFFSVKEVRKFLDENCKEEETYIFGVEDYMRTWIDNATDYHVSSDSSGYLIVNEKVRKERKERESEDEQKAIDLLESML